MTVFPQLLSCPLFDGIKESDLAALLACLGAHTMSANKGEFLLCEGDPATHIGVLLTGQAQVIRTDYFGNRTIMLGIAPGHLFAESFACAHAEKLPVSVLATEPCQYMLINCARMMTSCAQACTFHSRIIFNLLQIVADKNLIMHRRALITSERTTRKKLMTYLLMQAKEAASSSFSIPFDRQALADYLGVDRSGLSAEMSKLKKEGVLDYHKSTFRLHRLPEEHE